MSKRRKRTPSRIFGTYTLPSGQSAPGELRLKGSASLLSLYSGRKLPNFSDGSCIQGTSYKGERLTLIDCVPFGGEWSGTWHRFNVFPHVVVVGDDHLDPSKPCIKAIHFTTSDLTTLFYDSDAFGSVIHTESVIDAVLREHREMRPVETGAMPVIMYFTGKDRVAEVPTAIGKVSVHHRPRWTMGSPKGLSLKNRIVVSIEPEQSVTFEDAAERMMAIACFLSMAAGRAQVVSHIHVTRSEATDRTQKPLTIHFGLAPIWWTPGLCSQFGYSPVCFGRVRASVVVGGVQPPRVVVRLDEGEERRQSIGS
ncbi:MAG TPA: hypothetical protein VFL36_14995 [Myxococcales bacterium]|nr:hypothetical protein [Myxococcales bacterium]